MILVRPVARDPNARHRVSAVVPCYNYGRFLESCVQSILDQDGVTVDVTIVDDASTDNSADIAEEICRRDTRVRLVRHASNRGHIETFNHALSAATADLVVKMDADDLLPPGSLERSARLMTAFPHVSFVYGYPQTFSDAPPLFPESRERSWSVWAGQEWIHRILRRGHNVIMQPEVMMRRAALDSVGGHRAEIPEASDLNLWLRLASVGSIGRINGPVQGLYRVHDQSMQRTIHSGYLSDLRARQAAIDLFVDECWDRLDDPATARAIAHRSLAGTARRLVVRARDRGSEAEEPIAEYLAIASRLDPASRGLSPATASARLVQLAPARAFRGLQDRVRWRRWRRSGI